MASFQAADCPFQTGKHKEYIRKVSSDTESLEYLATQHLRMSGVYWGLTAMDLLGVDLCREKSYDGLLDWVMTAYDPESGGYNDCSSLSLSLSLSRSRSPSPNPNTHY